MSFRTIHHPYSNLTIWITQTVVVMGRKKEEETVREASLRALEARISDWREWKKRFVHMRESDFLKKNQIDTGFFKATPLRNMKMWYLKQVIPFTRSVRSILLSIEEVRFLARLFDDRPSLDNDDKWWAPVDLKATMQEWSKHQRRIPTTILAGSSQAIKSERNNKEREDLTALAEELNFHRNSYETIYDALTQIKSVRFRCPNRHGGTFKYWIRLIDDPPTEVNEIGLLRVKCSVCDFERELRYKLKNYIPGKKKQDSRLWELIE